MVAVRHFLKFVGLLKRGSIFYFYRVFQLVLVRMPYFLYIYETFKLCLENEQNNRNIEIINKDIFEYNPHDKFNIVTMVGSTVQEIGYYKEIFNKAP